MRQFVTIAALLSLTACSSMNEISKIPAQELVSKSVETAFNLPNYQVAIESKLDGVEFDTGAFGEEKYMPAVSSLVKNLSKNLSFEAVAQVDTVLKQYQVRPTYRYDSKNLMMSASLPMAYDGQKKHFYVDLSIADSLLNAPENSEKYARFDLSRFSPQLDKTGAVMDVLKKHTVGLYKNLDTSDFVDVPLTAQDRKNAVVRKIQVKTNVTKSFDLMPNMMADMAKIFKDDLKDEKMPDFSDKVFSQAMSDELNKMIGPGSEQIDILGMNNKGQLVQSESLAKVVFVPPKSKYDEQAEATMKPFTIRTRSNMRVFDIGTTKMLDMPNEANSVDGMENFKKSAMGLMIAPKSSSDDEAVEAAEPSHDAARDAGRAAARAVLAAAKATKSRSARKRR